MSPEITDFFQPFIQKERTLLIMGAGLTGTSLAGLLARYRIPFALYDRDLSPLQERLSGWEPYLEAAYEGDDFSFLSSGYSDILLSPGFPRREKVVVAAAAQAKVWNDIDFFYPLIKSKTIAAVTGTDGKSTTVELIRHLLGDDALSCGNNDVPAAMVLERILSPEIGIVVIEFSSYMLEKIYRFRADYNVILNIAPDHLDRYRDLDEYAAAKHNLLLHARPGDTYLYDLDHPETAPRNPRTRVITYGPGGDYTLRDNLYYFNGEEILDGDPSRLSAVLFPGNIFPALIIAREKGIGREEIERRLRSFSGLPHRLERIVGARNRRGEGFFAYNNSKATTLQSVIFSIEYLHRHHGKPVHLIMGGKSKNTDFHPLAEYRGKIAQAYFYGEAGETIREQSGLTGPYFYGLKETIERAKLDIPAGEVLVLAPGCSSFDQFNNYRARGDFFKEMVGE